MYQQPLHPAVAHLDQDELERLMDGYMSGIKSTILCEKFNISAHPSQLRKLLPSTVLAQVCSVCGGDMIRRVPSRLQGKVCTSHEECARCRHENNDSCQCSSCIKKREREIHEAQLQWRIKVKQAIVAIQPHETKVIPALSDMSLEMAVSLLAFIRCCPPDAQDVSEPVLMSVIPYAPTSNLANDLLKSLSMSGLIVLSEHSSEHTVDLDGEMLTYNAQCVRWKMPVNNRLEFVEAIEVAGLTGEWPSHWHDQIKPLWLKIALAECRQFYGYQAGARGLNIRGETAVTEMLVNLLRDYSVAQSYCLIWRGAQQAADFMVRERASRVHAANFMVGACQRFADKARAELWTVKAFGRNFDLPRSMISYVMFDVLLKIGERGFSEPIGNISNSV